MTTVIRENCGTYGGYQKHKKCREVACDGCRKANAEYMAARRADPEVKAVELHRQAARYRALWRLAAEYPARYRELFAEEVSP